MAKAQPQPPGPIPGRGVAGVPCTARGRGQAVAGRERWFSVSGFRFSVKDQLQKLLPTSLLLLVPIPWPLAPALPIPTPCTCPCRHNTWENCLSSLATSGASPVHCCQGWKRRARGAWDKMTRGVAGERRANSRASHRRWTAPISKTGPPTAGAREVSNPISWKPGNARENQGDPQRRTQEEFPLGPWSPSPHTAQTGAGRSARISRPKSRASGRPRWARSPAKSTNSGGGESLPISATARARARASGRRSLPSLR